MSGILDQFRLDGKTALVTGASRGLGAAMARALAEAGADVIVTARTLAGLEETKRAIETAGRRCFPYACDFRNREAIYDFLAAVTSQHPAVDILVNNAGTILRKPAAEHPDEFWDEVLAANLHAPFLLAREFGRRMVERGGGKIIFTASLLSFQGGITVPGYAASKGAIASLTKALANEWAASGVQVNAIAPGYMATDNTAALRGDPVRNPAILARIPAGRWGTPEDLMGAVVFLASAASDYVSGTILTVDGGWMGR
jgi:2-deoxy-D-gluconate 3-dehydrogenase